MSFKVFSVIFFLPCVPTTLASLPPGVMLLNCSTAPRDSATNTKKNIPKRRARARAT